MTNLSRTQKYVAGLVTGYGVTFLTIIIGLWLTPFTLKFLDREEYAIFTLASDTLMWLGLLDLGISSGLNAQVAQLAGRPNSEKLSRLASSAFFAQAVVSIVFILVGIGISAYFPTFFDIRPDLHHDTRFVLIMLSGTSALTILTQTFSSLLIAHQQIYIDNTIRLFLIVLRTALTVVLLWNGLGIVSLAIANLVSVVITSLLYVLRTFRLLPELRIRWKFFAFDTLKSTFKIGIWFTLGGIAGLLITQFDRLVVAKILSVELVTMMTLTGRVYALSNSFLQQITNTARPVFGQNLGRGNLDDTQNLFHQINKLSTGLAIVASFGLWAGNARFISFWVGPGFYGGWLLDLAFALNLIINAWVLPNRAVLAASMKFLPAHAASRFAEGILNLALSIWLGTVFGIAGVIFGTTLAAIAVSVWFLPWLTAKLFNQKFFYFFVRDNIRLAFFGVGSLIISLIFREASRGIQSDLIAFLFSSGAAILACSGLLWSFVLDQPIKQRLIQTLSDFVKRFRQPAITKSAS